MSDQVRIEVLVVFDIVGAAEFPSTACVVELEVVPDFLGLLAILQTNNPSRAAGHVPRKHKAGRRDPSRALSEVQQQGKARDRQITRVS